VRLGQDSGARLRVYRPTAAGWTAGNGAAPTYELRDPAEAEPQARSRAGLDNIFDTIVGAAAAAARPPRRTGSPPGRKRRGRWSGAASRPMLAARAGGHRLHLGRGARRTGGNGAAADRQRARDPPGGAVERLTLAIILAVTIALSVLLSLFLARTIARPLRRLARRRTGSGSAGRARWTCRASGRRDEIGLLARALHDMTQSLRYRIDATEAFAADVTHELKNPLASLRSAVDSLDRVEDPALQRSCSTSCATTSAARPADRRHRRSLAARCRAVARALRAGGSRQAGDRVAAARLWEQRAASAASASPSPGRGRGAPWSWATNRGWRGCSTISSTTPSPSRPPGGWSRSARRGVDGEQVASPSRMRGRACRRRQREAIFNRFHSIRPKARNSAAIPASASPSPRRSSRGMTAAIGSRTATTAAAAPVRDALSGGALHEH
jgi:two-component system sensor histidine kinase ChvG